MAFERFWSPVLFGIVQCDFIVGRDNHGRTDSTCGPYRRDAGGDGGNLLLVYEWVGLAFLRHLRRPPRVYLSHFFDDGPVNEGVAPPPLLSNAPKIAAALSSPALWPPVETTVCGTSRPISDTISGFS